MINAKSTLEVKEDLLSEYLSKLIQMDGTVVSYGYYSEDTHKPSGQPMGTIAYWLEEGTKHIPSRPFMYQSFSEHQMQSRGFKKAVKDYLYNNKGWELSFSAVGKEGKRLVKEIIEQGDFQPNSPVTVAIKGSDSPLIDTGYLKNNAKYKVEKE